jgi:hypothetical protein
MSNTIDNARKAAARALEREDAYRGEPLSLEQASRAAAEYIRSLIRDRATGYLREILSECSNDGLLRLMSKIAQALETNDNFDCIAAGSYHADLVASYLTNEIEAAADSLESRAEVRAQIAADHYWEQRRERGAA